jgi:hypothetical protein
MTRTNHYFYNNKKDFKKMTPQGENITTYLRKVSIHLHSFKSIKKIKISQKELCSAKASIAKISMINNGKILSAS